MKDYYLYREAGRIALDSAELSGKIRMTGKGFTLAGFNYRLPIDKAALEVVVGQKAIKVMAAKLHRKVYHE